MKILADLSTFEIVLFKSTMACIHTYFIVHAQRGNGNYLFGPRRERDKGKERYRERDRVKERERETGLTPFTSNFTDYAGQKPERYVLN